ncbi:hypothetical protein DFP94_10344 [Fontibacillus phaseoli]|uniref:Uncharacterized protein n=1 Tax=Fontibacillus phaseoli TaxID=1416533 RepID=A0A369BKV0_9BACL|nr:hypothetical protein DFP94_10344 [Fontibacillus phaseoli]
MQQDEFMNECLNRLKLHHPFRADLATLRKIQKRHLLNIPDPNGPFRIMMTEKDTYPVFKRAIASGKQQAIVSIPHSEGTANQMLQASLSTIGPS